MGVCAVSVFLAAVAQVDKTISESHQCLPLYKSLCLLPLYPFIHRLCPPPSGLRLLILTFHAILGAFLRSGETEVRGSGGEFASLSGASGNLISQQRRREEGLVVS
ncbi:hypothetical protein ATANTOWER_018439 [Ataeniobius toweri]|uniref:Secreted protein n=1 Tax=Ataeniobius toweri TaxID=208326 RepID=A0ABU7BAB5_9TELE|nr:hypothetical protein [Ataeniobius toweri]